MTEHDIPSRSGTPVEPVLRLSNSQIRAIHAGSMTLLDNPGLLCTNDKAAGRLNDAGCRLTRNEGAKSPWRIRFPRRLVEEHVAAAPSVLTLGARKPENRLVLNAAVPEVFFGTGSETNIYQTSRIADFVDKNNPAVMIKHPVFDNHRGSIARLCQSSKLCNALEQVDFFIRNVNIQDDEITPENKDVNTALAALMYMTKHVQMGLTRVESLDTLIRMAEIIAGGAEAYRSNPVLSFIACVIKSPLQIVDDTADKLIAVAERGIPLVISSSPQGGSTAPIQEEGITTLINAEILAGITLTQTVNPGTPVLYGAVPVRARLDTLHDYYGAPEFIHYNMNCIQMARFYQIPCYSTAGAGDAKIPGYQAAVEKLFPQLGVASAGAQYIHYAFGLLDKTNIFSPLQAVLDDAHVALVRQIIRPPVFHDSEVESAINEINKVLASSSRLFARHIRKAARKGLVTPPYPFETREGRDEVLVKAQNTLEHILQGPEDRLPDDVLNTITADIPGLLPFDRFTPDTPTTTKGEIR